MAGHDPVERLPVSRKLSGIMIAQALSPARRWLMAALSRRLKLREAAVLALVLVAIGTVYCQVYCLLALQKMHGVVIGTGDKLNLVSYLTLPPGTGGDTTGRPKGPVPMGCWLKALLLMESGPARSFSSTCLGRIVLKMPR